MNRQPTFGTLLCLRRGRLDEHWARCALGQEQAPLREDEQEREEAVLRTLRPFRPARVISSDLRRARGTAERLADRLDLPLGVRRELREQGFGLWQGRRWSEIVAEEEVEAAAFLGDFTRAVPPRGESLEEVRERVVSKTLHEFRRYRRQVVLYVGHAGPIRCLLAEALDLDLAAVQRLRLDPFSLTLIRFNGPGTTVELLNYPAAGEHPFDAPTE